MNEDLGPGSDPVMGEDETRAAENGGVHLLVVDGDVASARVLVRMLRDDGFEVELATDGGLAIARLSRDPMPSILVSDVHLPGADGTAVARYARSRSPGIAVFFVTARPELARPWTLDPAATVLKKPLEYGLLYQHIAEHAGLPPTPPSIRKPRRGP